MWYLYYTFVAASFFYWKTVQFATNLNFRHRWSNMLNASGGICYKGFPAVKNWKSVKSLWFGLQRIRGVLAHDDALYKSTFYLLTYLLTSGICRIHKWPNDRYASAWEILLHTSCVLDRFVSTGDRATSSTSSSNGRHDVEYHLRLCHVVEWPDFSGFGFNVHTLRDKPGQYVGKVDSGSPAAAAGLSSV